METAPRPHESGAATTHPTAEKDVQTERSQRQRNRDKGCYSVPFRRAPMTRGICRWLRKENAQVSHTPPKRLFIVKGCAVTRR